MAKDIKEIIALQKSELQRLATNMAQHGNHPDLTIYIKELKAWFRHPQAAKITSTKEFLEIIRGAWETSPEIFGPVMLAALLDDPSVCKDIVGYLDSTASDALVLTIIHIMAHDTERAPQIVAKEIQQNQQNLFRLKQNILNTKNILSIVCLFLMTGYSNPLYKNAFDLLFSEIMRNNSKLALNLSMNGRNLFSLLLKNKAFQALEFLLKTHAKEDFPQTQEILTDEAMGANFNHPIYGRDFSAMMMAIVAILDLAGKYDIPPDSFQCHYLQTIKGNNAAFFSSIAHLMFKLISETELSNSIIIEALLSHCPELQRLMSNVFSPKHQHGYPEQQHALQEALILALDLYRVNKLPKVVANEHNRLLHGVARLMNQAYRQNYGHIATKVMLTQPAAIQDGIATITTALKNMLKSQELDIAQLNSAENRKLLCNKVAQFAHNTGNLNVINVQNLIQEFTKDLKKLAEENATISPEHGYLLGITALVDETAQKKKLK